MSALLAGRSAVDAVGIDPSEEMLDSAHRRASAGCRFVGGRAEALPFPDGLARAERDMPDHFQSVLQLVCLTGHA